jgi:class 3 adenylate cyclase
MGHGVRRGAASIRRGIVVEEMSVETRYSETRDGLSIAYQVFGDGPHNLVCVPGTASHVELFWELPGLPGRRLRERLASFARCVFFDKRGTGLSDRSLGTGSLEDRMEDVRAVTDVNGMDSAVLLGLSEGGPMSVLYAATFPDRVDKLILYGAYARGSDFVTPEVVEMFADNWGNGSIMHRVWCDGYGDRDALARIERATATPRAIAEFMALNGTIDVECVLGSVSVPTLVMEAADRQRALSGPVLRFADVSREMAEKIPGARLELFDGSFHGTADVADADRVIDVIEEFVTGDTPHRPGRVDDRLLATVVFTDLVGSTTRAAAEGDDRWMQLMDDHDRVCKRSVEEYHGRWIKSTGDGMLASFDGPARAILAAHKILDHLKPLGLNIRAGVHTGEIELRGDDIGGLAVNIAARVMDAARDGEVWVSPTVPGLTVGAGIEFTDRGRHELKGIPVSMELAAARPPE